MLCNYWSFMTMCVAVGVLLFLGVYRHSLVEVIIATSFVLSAFGWHMEKRRSMNYLSTLESVNDVLIKNNKELYEKNQEQQNLIEGLISDTKDLKLKLKNSKMESARLRNKGGRRDE